MTKRPAGPPGRGPQGRGPRGTVGRDDKSSPGAARASGRHTGNPPRSPGGTTARRPARNGGAPSPRTNPQGTNAGRGGTGRTGTSRTVPSRPAPRRTRPEPPRRRPRPRIPFVRRDPLKRLNVGLLAVAFVLSLFAGRLVQLQTIESDKYSKKALEQRLIRMDLPAGRGDITDAQGNALAMTVEARGVYADPFIIKPEKRQEIANALGPILSRDPAQIMKVLGKDKSRFEYLAHGVPPDQARVVTSLKFLGIGTKPEYRREYPNTSLAAGVIGFVNASGQGAAGLEYSMNSRLAGRDGHQLVEISPEGQHIPMGENQKKPPVPGRDLRLTLLRDVQFRAQQAIEQRVRETGARSGSVIVMDPRNGQLLAMASAPGFDPNSYGRYPQATWGSPIVQEAYEPGSTNKVVTAAAVMEKGGVRPETVFHVPDRLKKYDRTFRDSHDHPPEDLTFAGVLAKSSNIGTIKASERISQDVLYQYLRDFGFGSKTEVGLPGETAGQLKAPNQWSGTDRYPIAFGQTMSVNALQMASVYATIANGGVRVTPNLISGTTDDNGAFTPAATPVQKRVISSETARELRDMLEGAATPEGTAPKARIDGYRVAGKTGTASLVDPKTGRYYSGRYTASFAGFAPADDPQLVVQVVLQDPRKGSRYGGDVAAPVFKDVMSFALGTRKIPPTGSKPPKVKIYARR